MTTLAYVDVDPELETLELVNAGHPPPLVIQPGRDGDATCRCRAASRSAHPRWRATAPTPTLPPGRVVVLYTDGLVERRGESIDAGPRAPAGAEHRRRRAGGALRRASSTSWCPTTRADDIAIIAARVPAAARPADAARWPAEPDVAGRTSASCCAAGCARRARPRTRLYDIVVACQEACANAVEHAYAPGPADLRRRRRPATADASAITVRDSGQLAPAAGQRPRAGAADDARADGDAWTSSHTDEGTVVVLERTLQGGAA